MQRGGSTDAWSSSQAVAALGRAGESAPKGVDGIFLELKEGGWIQRDKEPPQGAILMWATAATALARDDRRHRCRELMNLHAARDGGWSMYANP
jgi:hypothetical protein